MNNQWVWIDTSVKMDEAKEDISSSSIICVDTEYDSFRYFREVLCLVQIAADKKTYLLDPLNGLDFSFLGKIYADSAILKIMHAGDNDIRILKRDYGFEFKNIFDTHLAAAILGCHFLSLSALIGQYLGIELKKDKKMQRSKWETRPLTEEQIHYAVQDTAFLKALYNRLDHEIQRRGFKRKAVKAFDTIAAVTWNEKLLNPLGYKNIKGYHSLTEHQKHYLMNLNCWRFQKAKETNRARFRILSDQTLVDLAKTEASSIEMLKETGILSPEKISLYGPEIIETVSDNK
ncbi:MAG: ribonuclease D [Deltaproteobacteria bacterium]|nr:ribonuclease D [Deltaproteobacteria bacterium]